MKKALSIRATLLLSLSLTVGTVLTGLRLTQAEAASPGRPDLMLSIKDTANSDIVISKALPKKGDKVNIAFKVHNIGDADATGVSVQVCQKNMRTGQVVILRDFHGESGLQVPAGGVVECTCTWEIPATSDFYGIQVKIDPANAIAETDENNNEATWTVPVLDKDKDMVVYQTLAPRTIRYFTATETANGMTDTDIKYWQRRGIKVMKRAYSYYWTDDPASAKFYTAPWWQIDGSIYNTWKKNLIPLSPGTARYDGIGMDEFMPNHDYRTTTIPALAAMKADPDYRDMSAYLEFGGSGWGKTWETNGTFRSMLDLGDCFLLERYLSSYPADYKTNPWSFDRAWDNLSSEILPAVKAKTIFLLGAMPAGGWITNEREIKRQFRYVKEHEPDMRGIGLYNLHTPEYLEQQFDAQIYNYFIKPVIYEVSDSDTQLTIRNIGGMKAYGVKVRWDGTPSVSQVDIAAGETNVLKKRHQSYQIEPSEFYTRFTEDGVITDTGPLNKMRASATRYFYKGQTSENPALQDGLYDKTIVQKHFRITPSEGHRCRLAFDVKVSTVQADFANVTIGLSSSTNDDTKLTMSLTPYTSTNDLYGGLYYRSPELYIVDYTIDMKPIYYDGTGWAKGWASSFNEAISPALVANKWYHAVLDYFPAAADGMRPTVRAVIFDGPGIYSHEGDSNPENPLSSKVWDSGVIQVAGNAKFDRVYFKAKGYPSGLHKSYAEVKSENLGNVQSTWPAIFMRALAGKWEDVMPSFDADVTNIRYTHE